MFNKTPKQKELCNIIAECKYFIKNNNPVYNLYNPGCYCYSCCYRYSSTGSISVFQQDEKVTPNYFLLYIQKEKYRIDVVGHFVFRFRFYVWYGDKEFKCWSMKGDYGYRKIARLYNMCLRKCHSK